MESVKLNIRFVKAAIENGDMKKNKEILLQKLSESLAEINDSNFHFTVPYLSKQGHLLTARYVVMKYRSKLITDLEELQVQISGIYGSEKRCLQIIKQLLETSLYKTIIIKMCQRFIPIRGGYYAKTPISHAVVSVKEVGKR